MPAPDSDLSAEAYPSAAEEVRERHPGHHEALAAAAPRRLMLRGGTILALLFPLLRLASTTREAGDHG